jgi:hypothetical protein
MDSATIERPHHRCEPGTATRANDSRETTAPAEARARQREVSGIGVLVLGAVIAASLRADLFVPDRRVLVDPGALRVMSLAVAVGFLAYAIEQDRRLRALEARHDMPTAAPRPVEVAVTLRMHRAQLLGEVVDAVLADVQDASAAEGVELRLLGFDGRARFAGRRGDRSGSMQAVALQQGGRVLGELLVHGALRADAARLDTLGELASAALERARRHEHTMNVLGELRDAVASPVVTLVD